MTDERIISYLLEELPEAELERFEDECFVQEEWPDQISQVEEDLIEAYLLHELTPERHQRFEQNYLITKARYERVVITAALLRQVSEHNTAAQSWAERLQTFWLTMTWERRTAAAVVAVAFIAGAIWLIIPQTHLPQTFATLRLTISNGDRATGSQIDKIKLSPDTDALKISLILPQQSPTAAHYRVEFLDNAGNNKPLNITEQDDRSVQVVILADELTKRQYALNLFAIKADGTEQRINGSYFFIVE
jgi:hypothetical protein